MVRCRHNLKTEITFVNYDNHQAFSRDIEKDLIWQEGQLSVIAVYPSYPF